jgi:hypothetical protein
MSDFYLEAAKRRYHDLSVQQSEANARLERYRLDGDEYSSR